MTSGEYSEAAIWVRQVQSRGSDQCVWPWIVTWTQTLGVIAMVTISASFDTER